VCERQLLNWTADADAGVVEQQVEMAVLIVHCSDRTRKAARVGDIQA
jgi:hypothetical protein